VCVCVCVCVCICVCVCVCVMQIDTSYGHLQDRNGQVDTQHTQYVPVSVCVRVMYI